MKTKKLVLIGMTMLASSSVFASGNGAGNGGGAWVCRDSKAKVTRAELVDLWEAEHDPTIALKITRSNATLSQQRNDVLSKLDNTVAGKLSDAIDDIMNLLLKGKVETAASVTVVKDALYSIEPEESEYCSVGSKLKYEQVVNYRDDGSIIFSSEIFDDQVHFSNTDRTALLFHEAIYRADRNVLSATDSRRTRKVVGYLFGGSNGTTERTLEVLFGDKTYQFFRLPKETRSVEVSLHIEANANSDSGEALYPPAAFAIADIMNTEDLTKKYFLTDKSINFQNYHGNVGTIISMSSELGLNVIDNIQAYRGKTLSFDEIALTAPAKNGLCKKSSTLSEGEFDFSNDVAVNVTIRIRDADTKKILGTFQVNKNWKIGDVFLGIQNFNIDIGRPTEIFD